MNQSEAYPARSIVTPVLDFSDHGGYNITTLLEDLEGVDGEVICVFNSPEVFERLKDHPRITRFAYNSQNAGVSRSWNMGINLAEGRAVHVLNADMHLEPGALQDLESYLFNLENAVMVGPQGSHLDYKNLKVAAYFQKGKFDDPVRTHDVSGFWFCLHRQRYLDAKLAFDVRFSPCQFEEWDMGLQVIQAGLSCYAAPVTGFEHHWGVSAESGDRVINYFGRDMFLKDIYKANQEWFSKKWAELFAKL
jgi:GT2 family glycosyltransferase